MNPSIDELLGMELDAPILKVELIDKNWLQIPILSRKITACCDSEVSLYEITKNTEAYIPVRRSYFKSYDELRQPFVIYAEGTCLESSGIFDGNEVVINPAEEPTNGTLACILIYGMLSIKRIYRLKDDIVLRSDDGDKRLTVEEQKKSDFCIVGTVVRWIHGRPKAEPY